jgi:hypothetical protein
MRRMQSEKARRDSFGRSSRRALKKLGSARSAISSKRFCVSLISPLLVKAQPSSCLWTDLQAIGARMKTLNVFELLLHTRFDLEHHARDLESVKRTLRATAHVTGHGHRSVTIVFTTHEPASDLMDRLRPILTDRFENAWICTAPQDIVSLHGSVDPRQSRINEHYRRLRDGFDTKYVGEIERRPERFVRSVEDGPRRAPVQVHRKAAPKWGPTQNPNRPKR